MTRPSDQQNADFTFDVLEALKSHFPEIAFCFARGTGGIEKDAILSIIARNTQRLDQHSTALVNLSAYVLDLRNALSLSRDLIATIEQSSGNVWFVNASDPETAVCNTSDTVDRALAITQPATSQEGEDVDRVAKAIYETGGSFADQHGSIAWADLDGSNDAENFRKMARAALAATPTPPTLPEDLREAAQAQEDAEDLRQDCSDCDGEGMWEHCPSCSMTFGRAIELRRAALAQVKAS